MRFYLLSSTEIVDKEKFKEMIPKWSNKMAYIPNAKDYIKDKTEFLKSSEEKIKLMADLGLEIEIVDLKDYFEDQRALQDKMEEFGTIWVRGGNVFILRQAMEISGFDKIMKEYHKSNRDVLYSGNSAGACVLSPTIKGIELIDDISRNLHSEKIIWDGLGILEFCIVPHYKTPKSLEYLKLVDNVVNYYEKENIKYKTIRDGEFLTID